MRIDDRFTPYAEIEAVERRQEKLWLITADKRVPIRLYEGNDSVVALEQRIDDALACYQQSKSLPASQWAGELSEKSRNRFAARLLSADYRHAYLDRDRALQVACDAHLAPNLRLLAAEALSLAGVLDAAERTTLSAAAARSANRSLANAFVRLTKWSPRRQYVSSDAADERRRKINPAVG